MDPAGWGRPLDPLNKEPTMLKTISAAVLAATMIAAPALAANSGNKAQGTANTTTQTQSQNTATAPKQTNAQATPAKSNNLNAHARMTRHHYRHKKISLHKSHGNVASKVSGKQAAPATKGS
jgi:hypothetical protein